MIKSAYEIVAKFSRYVTTDGQCTYSLSFNNNVNRYRYLVILYIGKKIAQRQYNDKLSFRITNTVRDDNVRKEFTQSHKSISLFRENFLTTFFSFHNSVIINSHRLQIVKSGKHFTFILKI